MEEEKFDGVLYTMVQSSGGYEGFFDLVFGFLTRKTDFFSNVKKAEEIIGQAGIKYIKKQQEKKQKEENVQKTQNIKSEPKKENKPVQKETVVEPKIEKTIESNKTVSSDPVPENNKLLPNSGNGSSTDLYFWTQTLTEVQIQIPLPDNIRGKDLIVNFETTKISIMTKDKQKVYLDGDLYDKIHTDECVWTIEDNDGKKIIEVNIAKWKNTTNWWSYLIKGEKEIDTQKINPETSKLSDLDGDMRSTVEKMMFDMNQKQKGLPSSDELQKQEKLKEFMKAHPEMDFSKAKFA